MFVIAQRGRLSHLAAMKPIADDSLRQVFLEARTFSAWSPEPVSDDLLRRVYDLAKLGATATNSHPTRFLFVKSPEAKLRLEPTLSPGNVDKVRAAPVTVVVAFDERFHEKMPTLFPARGAQLVESLGAMPADKRDFMLVQNSGLEAAYLMLAARSLGLDCGPMAGFDRAKVDATFFEGTTWRSVLLINLGHGDREKIHPRLPRFDFETACRIA